MKKKMALSDTSFQAFFTYERHKMFSNFPKVDVPSYEVL